MIPKIIKISIGKLIDKYFGDLTSLEREKLKKSYSNHKTPGSDSSEIIIAIRTRVVNQLCLRHIDYITKNLTNEIKIEALEIIKNAVLHGKSSQVVSQLNKKLGKNTADWKSLSRTLIGNAQILAKQEMYLSQGIEKFEWQAAPDSCTTCLALRDGGPYSSKNGPNILEHTHPNCRCTIEAYLP